jgi:hypothetical protein
VLDWILKDNLEESLVLYGAGLYSQIICKRFSLTPILYIDDQIAASDTEFQGIEVLSLSDYELDPSHEIVVCAYSNIAQRAISKKLDSAGVSYRLFEDCVRPSSHNKRYEILKSNFRRSSVENKSGVLASSQILSDLDHSSSYLEVGAYQGGNAKLLLESINSVDSLDKFTLADTFSGFMKDYNDNINEERLCDFSKNSISLVQENLRRYPFVHFEQVDLLQVMLQDDYSLIYFDADLPEKFSKQEEYIAGQIDKGSTFYCHDILIENYELPSGATQPFLGLTESVLEFVDRNRFSIEIDQLGLLARIQAERMQ